MTSPDRAPATEAGRKLLDAWQLVPEHGAPNRVVIRDAILAIEAEAPAAPQPTEALRVALDVERLAQALYGLRPAHRVPDYWPDAEQLASAYLATEQEEG